MPSITPEPELPGQAEWARLYLLVTALEEMIEDGAAEPAASLRRFHEEYSALLVAAEPRSDEELLRRELRYGRRLLDALSKGDRLDERMLTRPGRPCASLGCGNDALGRYCLSCEARRAVS